MVQQFLGFHGFSFDERRSPASRDLARASRRVTAELRQMTERYFGFPALVLEPGVRTGMPILYDNPKEVGADRIANAVGAYDLYGGPSIVVDFGTATTIEAVSAKGEYLGGAIFPGVEISMDALFGRAAGLRRVELVEPKHVIGKSTAESIQSGMIYGFSAQVDGLVDRFVAELGPCEVIATGGLAELIIPHSRTVQHYEPWLTLSVCGSSSNGTADGRDGRCRRARGSPRSRRSAPAATTRTRSASTAPTRSARCASTGTTRIETGTSTDDVVRVAGRVLLKRDQGKLVFAKLRDGTGELQLFVSQGELGDDAFARFGDEVDRGDWVGVEGTVMKTKLGELSVNVSSFQLLVEGAAAAAREVARPLRHRHALPPALRRPHRQRRGAPRVRRPVRRGRARCGRFLAERGFIEVETPVLHPIAGGATARPFIDASQRARRRALPAHRARALPEAAHRRRLRPACSSSRACSATRACRPGTIPSSRCSSSTRRSPTTPT